MNNDRLRFRYFQDEMRYLEPQEGVRWMQCTGLRDKTGRLIYEGDIVATKESLPKTFLVSWAIGYDEPPGWNITGFCLPSNVEVVGNIREHPHLLDKNSIWNRPNLAEVPRSPTTPGKDKG